MGKERDDLIKRYGETPLSEQEDVKDSDLVKERMAHYARKGRLPPEIEALRRKQAEEDAKKKDD